MEFGISFELSVPRPFGSAIEKQTRDVDDVVRHRFAPARIPGDVMKQRRPGEVAVGRLEIGPRMDELGMLRQQLLEATEISGNERGDRLVECRVGFELRDALARLDFVFEGRPTLEAVFAGDDELGVGERELCAEYGGRRRAISPGK